MITLAIVFVLFIIVFTIIVKKNDIDFDQGAVSFLLILPIMLITILITILIDPTYTEIKTTHNINESSIKVVNVENINYYMIEVINKDSISQIIAIPVENVTIKVGQICKLVKHHFEKTDCVRNNFVIGEYNPCDKFDLIITKKTNNENI